MYCIHLLGSAKDNKKSVFGRTISSSSRKQAWGARATHSGKENIRAPLTRSNQRRTTKSNTGYSVINLDNNRDNQRRTTTQTQTRISDLPRSNRSGSGSRQRNQNRRSHTRVSQEAVLLANDSFMPYDDKLKQIEESINRLKNNRKTVDSQRRERLNQEPSDRKYGDEYDDDDGDYPVFDPSVDNPLNILSESVSLSQLQSIDFDKRKAEHAKNLAAIEQAYSESQRQQQIAPFVDTVNFPVQRTVHNSRYAKAKKTVTYSKPTYTSIANLAVGHNNISLIPNSEK